MYPVQPTRRVRPVLCPACGRLSRISLGHQPSLPPVRRLPFRASPPAAGGGFPAPLFRSRSGFTVPPWPAAPHVGALFPAFSGTTLVSDFPTACTSGLWPQAFPDRPAIGQEPPHRVSVWKAPLPGRWAGTAGISRFSNMECSRMRRVSDSAGPMSRLAIPPCIVWPSLPGYEVGAPVRVFSEFHGWPACTPVNAYDVPSRTRRHDSGPWRVATAFHVRLFHSLLHAGLSRRSACPHFLRLT